MADQDAKDAENAIEVRGSVEAKQDTTHPASNEVDPEEVTNVGADADADADADGDVEMGDVDADGDGDEDEDDAAGDDDEDGDSGPPGKLSNDMFTVIENTANYLSGYTEANGHRISDHFQRIPNRRLMPEYYEVIKEAIAFSTIRTKKLRKQYASFSEFVHDVALVAHNAQVYNRASSEIFQDAHRLIEVFKVELQKLVDEGTITPDEATIPDLGEIPDAEDSPNPDDEDIDEDDEDDDDEDDEDDTDDESGRRRGRRSRAGRKSDATKEEDHKKRGRPPKVFTPLEARIHALLKGLRKLKHPTGELLILPFEKLPDKVANPDYYATIQNPIALDLIKRKAKRKKYQNVDQVMKDVELMFDNAKEYNEESSQIYLDAAELQNHARQLAEQEKAKPDNDFEDEDGRRPLSEIHHKGEVWKVGDWVHVTNPNDLTKPIVAQIYRTWEDRAGDKWVNACWYYRPEQTVHRFEKHFLENEVVKTGQYRDHRIDEIVDRCFVMFVTRYNKGRPRGLPKDKEVYVCEARYNEEKHKLNKIKTWASCVPDEVREKDYEMDLFDVPRKLKKIPSPIKHLLRDDAKPTDPLPKPTWGAPNAPPLIGAVHCREREANESPPPEPTPSPPPPALAEPAHRPSMMQSRPSVDGQGDVAMANAAHFPPTPAAPTPTPSGAAYAPAHFPARPSPSPVPVPQYGAQPGYLGSGHATPQMPQTPHYQPHPQSHQPAPPYTNYVPQYNASPVPVPQQPQHQFNHQMNNALGGYDPTQRVMQASPRAPMPNPGMPHVAQATAMYHPPRPVEVYKLDDALNERIPEDIRQQFKRDEQGHVLFFTQPPLDRPHRGLSKESAGLGHSVRYLADVMREREDRRAKRKARDEGRAEEEKRRREQEEKELLEQRKELADLAGDLFNGWVKTIENENEVLKQAYAGWSVKDADINKFKA